ncbi:hypothetical protein JB92DRAFT_2854649 [Gautieria morchelliformis]|nr:hypothetical protein JB92DRAFT_2854649 [Gautieria morchelliformis]
MLYFNSSLAPILLYVVHLLNASYIYIRCTRFSYAMLIEAHTGEGLNRQMCLCLQDTICHGQRRSLGIGARTLRMPSQETPAPLCPPLAVELCTLGASHCLFTITYGNK